MRQGLGRKGSSRQVCGVADETVVHIVSEYSKLALEKYKEVRHDKVSYMIH